MIVERTKWLGKRVALKPDAANVMSSPPYVDAFTGCTPVNVGSKVNVANVCERVGTNTQTRSPTK